MSNAEFVLDTDGPLLEIHDPAPSMVVRDSDGRPRALTVTIDGERFLLCLIPTARDFSKRETTNG